jgi:ABC-type polysaccharide/polyol phosphate export permease
MSVYALVFSVYLRFGTENYVVFLISGLLPLLLFSSSLLEASGSILAGGNLIKKVLFPAEVLPLVVVLSNFVNFLLSLPILLIFLIVFKRPIGLAFISLPVIMLIQMVFTIGLAFLFYALCVHYRDIQHILANFLTLWFFLTPIIYPLKNIPEQFRFTVNLNPIASLVLAYQNIFYDGRFPNFVQLSGVAFMAVLIYLLGASIFERYRGIFAEEV